MVYKSLLFLCKLVWFEQKTELSNRCQILAGNEIILLSTSNDFFSKGDLIVFVKCMQVVNQFSADYWQLSIVKRQ